VKLLDACYDQIAFSSARQSGKLGFKPKSLPFETLFECVGLRAISYSHPGISAVAGPGCWPSDRVERTPCLRVRLQDIDFT
jgi:hypothetical protein